jgi:hypothetical protein
MDYEEILATGLTWYAIGGVAVLIGSVVVYGLAVLIYRLLAWLIRLAKQLLGHVVGHLDASLRHHRFG